jgi:hypothetical protein
MSSVCMGPVRMGQRGFIQGVIIFALALIAIVVATLSSGSSDNSEQISKEQSNAYANEMIAAGGRAQDAYFRALADGNQGLVSSNNVVTLMVGATAASAPQTWTLASYAQLPILDSDAYLNRTTGTWRTYASALNTTAAPSQNSPGNLVIEHGPVKMALCEAINRKTTNTRDNTWPAFNNAATNYFNIASSMNMVNSAGLSLTGSKIEGCYYNGIAISAGGTYFRVLHHNFIPGL